MSLFSEIVGHEQIKEHLQKAISGEKAFHAYIFQGEQGTGKKLMARAFAAGLQCSGTGDKPCGECKSCKQQASGNHPDIIWITHEKSGIGVDDIREQLNNTMDIKPFSGQYKIYIVPEAEKMTEAAQNALLKTIEEPPAYGVVILLTSNINMLLPTIQSRCLTLEFRPLTNVTVEKFLLEHCQVPDYLAKMSATFAQGNLGKAIRYVKSDDFVEKKDKILYLLKNKQDMTLYEMMTVMKEIGEDKDSVSDYIDLMVLWYRDVLLYKATKDVNQLMFRENYSDISREASKKGYVQIENILQAFDKAKLRLRANVNYDVAIELMLLTMIE